MDEAARRCREAALSHTRVEWHLTSKLVLKPTDHAACGWLARFNEGKSWHNSTRERAE